jgi:hypothetical protein
MSLKQKLAEYNNPSFGADEFAQVLPDILAYYQEVYTTYIYCDSDEYLVTLEDENELVRLIEAIEEQRLRIFQHLILNKKFNNARRLVKPEHIEIYDLTRFIHFALKTANHELLDFLLTQYEFPINTSEFDNLTPAMYCLTKSKDMPHIKSCFWILVKHKACLNEKDPETSQSIMETILFTPNHPLKPNSSDLTLLPSPLAKIENEISRERDRNKKISVKRAKQNLKECTRNLQEALIALEAIQALAELGARILEEAQKSSTPTQKTPEGARTVLEPDSKPKPKRTLPFFNNTLQRNQTEDVPQSETSNAPQ